MTKNKKIIKKAAVARKLARRLKRAAAAQARDTRRPPFAEVNAERRGVSLMDRTRRAAQAGEEDLVFVPVLGRKAGHYSGASGGAGRPENRGHRLDGTPVPNEMPHASSASPETDTEDLSPGEQAKSKLIAILQAIPEQDYSDALQTLCSYWLNGMHHGYQKGFGAGWADHCELVGERRSRPFQSVAPSECTPPAWPEAEQEDGVLDFVGCVLSLQAARTDDETREKRIVEFQWGVLDRVYSDAHAKGESRGRKLGMITSALTEFGAAAA